MKVIFRSNEAIQAEGFRAQWNENCGGIFEATRNPKIIQSPSYPNLYRANLFCNYTIIAPEQDIIVDFMAFQLERSKRELSTFIRDHLMIGDNNVIGALTMFSGRRDCSFDNLTIVSGNMYGTDTETYCGEDKPPMLKSWNKVEIIFKTDKYIQRTGFVFKYHLSSTSLLIVTIESEQFVSKLVPCSTGCGGTITSPGEIQPPMSEGTYFGGMTCTWILRAPSDKNVVIRFDYFVLEYSSR